MQALAFYIALPFFYILSVLPEPILYGVSDTIYFILYKVLGYRKKVVFSNLRNAFPNKSEAEINSIAEKFYHNLCDIFLEILQTLTISKERALKKVYLKPESVEMINSFAKNKQSIILVLGHFGNWEWGGNCLAQQFAGTPYIIYHQLSNPYFDQFMLKLRTRFGCKLVEMKQVYKQMLANKNKVTATAFIADQTPSTENAYWTIFLNQPTAVFKGTEVLSKKFNYPVIYISVKRPQRGVYEATTEILTLNPKMTIEGEISEMHTKSLEKDIFACPELWLWSHRRWKHKPTKEIIEQLYKNG